MNEGPEKTSEFTIKKKVDESWKNSIQKERESLPTEPEQEPPVPEPNFPFFISTLGMQALLALGEIPDPATGEKKADLAQAKYLIDIIQMLSEKTKGNLSEEESQIVKDLLYDLRVKFVKKAQQP